MSGEHDHVCEGKLLGQPHVAILGLGLIGGSFAAALKKAKACAHITGFDKDITASEFALRNGYIDTLARSAEEAVAQADIIILATPPKALGETARLIAPVLRQGAVVSDVASVKEAAIAAITAHLPASVDYVPAHPIAGKSTGGIQMADEGLFYEKLVILSPDRENTHDRAITAITQLWQRIGAVVERIASRNHDILYAYVSHLPQLLAYSACVALDGETLGSDIPDTFRRFIRLGGSDTRLWADIAYANHEFVTHGLAHILATIDHMNKELSDGERKNEASTDSPHVPLSFFPMMIAGSYISVIQQFESQNSIRVGGYAGTGFMDFTAPASEDPQQFLEDISKSFGHTLRLTRTFHTHLAAMHNALLDPTEAGQQHFTHLLEQGRTAHKRIADTLVKAEEALNQTS